MIHIYDFYTEMFLCLVNNLTRLPLSVENFPRLQLIITNVGKAKE